MLLFTIIRRVLPRHSVITARLTWIPGNNNDDDPENPSPNHPTTQSPSSETVTVDPQKPGHDPSLPTPTPSPQPPKDPTEEEEEEIEEIIKYLPTLDKVDDDYDDIYEYYRQDQNSNIFLTVQSPDEQGFGQRPELMIQIHTIPKSPGRISSPNPPRIPPIPRTPTFDLPPPDSGEFDPITLASGQTRPSPRTFKFPMAYPSESSESEYEYSERESPVSGDLRDERDVVVRSPVSAPGPGPGPVGGLMVPREPMRFATPQVATFARNIFSRRS